MSASSPTGAASLMACGNKVLPPLLGVSALVFLVMGAAFVAPYWLFDGLSFACTFVVGRLAIRRALPPLGSEANPPAGAHKLYCRVVCTVAALSIVAELSFLVTAVLLWNKVMNPLAWNGYGRDGSSFFFCSLYSATCNTAVLVHFCRLKSRSPYAAASK